MKPQLEIVCEPNCASEAELWAFYLKRNAKVKGDGEYLGWMNLDRRTALSLRNLMRRSTSMTLRVKFSKQHFDEAQPPNPIGKFKKRTPPA